MRPINYLELCAGRTVVSTTISLYKKIQKAENMEDLIKRMLCDKRPILSTEKSARKEEVERREKKTKD